MGMIGAVFENKAVFFGGLNPTTRAPYSNIFTLGPFPSLKDQTFILSNPVVPDLARGYAASTSVSSGIVIAFGNNGLKTVSSAYLLTRGNSVIFPNSVALNNGTLPSAREGTTAVNVTSTKVLFYGGRSGSVYYNEIWELDTSDGDRWTWELISKDSGLERAFHTANLIGRVMVVWGGLSSDANPTDDNPIFFDTILRKWISFPGDFFSIPALPSSTSSNVPPASLSPSPQAKVLNNGNSIGTGGLVGGLVGTVIVAVGILLISRKKRKNKRNTSSIVDQPENASEPLEEAHVEPEAPPAYAPTSPDYGIEQPPSTRMDGAQQRTGSLRPRSGYESVVSQRSSMAANLSLNSGSTTEVSSVRNSMIPVSLTSEVTYINGQPYIPMFPCVPTSGETFRPFNRSSTVSDNSGGRPVSSACSNSPMIPPISTMIPEVPHDTIVPSPTTSRAVIAKAECVRNHKPLMADELEMIVGDVVEIFEHFNDGWATGRNNRLNNKEGVFPIDAVKVFEKSSSAT
ncbi:hypothetical protein HK098_000196 [Nowakowskiella sp. JEL0407]|nr:hypothetical protein HK098_000196 [Nowakowskiella sp. JEL0407]